MSLPINTFCRIGIVILDQNHQPASAKAQKPKRNFAIGGEFVYS